MKTAMVFEYIKMNEIELKTLMNCANLAVRGNNADIPLDKKTFVSTI